MKPFYNLLAALLILSALQAQTPWTNWGIYRDSTGNGANPVSGGPVCDGDTLWLIVDTTGMAAAGITGYKWVRVTGTPPPLLIHCSGSPDCPSTLPQYFPVSGVGNTRKIGIKPNFYGTQQSLVFITYYSNGDSAISARAYHTKGPIGGALIQLPQQACAGSTVNGRLRFSGYVDSIVITYGTTTIRNQTDFTVTLPSGSGSLTVTATLYYCGNTVLSTNTIDYYSTPPAGYAPSVYPLAVASCPSAPLTLEVPLIPSGYTSFIWKVNGNSVDPSSTNHTLSYIWTPPGPGTYTISYEATYPCGTVTGSTSYTVSSPTPPSWNYVYVNPSSYCPGMDVTISAYAGVGLHTIDIGDDGSIEVIGGSAYYQGPIGPIPSGGLPIRIRFDNGCGGIKDTLISYNPLLGSASGSAIIGVSPPNARCSQYVQARLVVTNFPEDSIKQVQWSWDGNNWTPPSNNLTALLQVPSTPGPWTLRCRFTATSPASCLTAPASPLTTTVFFNTSIPLLTQLSSFCTTSGGAVQLVPNGNLDGIDSIRYMLPNGTSIVRSPTDTLVLTVPPGSSAYPIAYYGYTQCGLTGIGSYSITLSPKPFIFASVWPSSICSGGSVDVVANWSFTQVVDSVVAILWNGQRVLVPVTGSGWASMQISAPGTPGYYNVTFIAYNCAGTDTVVRTFQVTGGSDAVASFTAPSSACVGQPVTFQRNGTNAGILNVSWSFGDGNIRSDTSMTVSHTYTAAGTYTVNLWLQSLQCGSSSFERVIRVYDAPPALSGLNVTHSGLTITYSIASASDYDQIVWDFGDGNTASGVLGGTHTYASAGTYTVKVQAINACDTTELSTSVSVSTSLLSGGANAWVVYPNPTRQEVFLTHPTYQGDLRVEIYDLTGRLVQTETVSSYPARVRLSLPSGIYTLRLISREGVATSRLLIE